MKTHLFNKILFILFLLPVYVFAQPGSLSETDITGLWKGELYNDTTRKFLPYEIAISEDKGKLTGYSYTLFDFDGKKEMNIKKVKIKRKDDRLIIEDVEMLTNTYSVPAPRGIKWTGTVNLSSNDSVMELRGNWTTNRTKEYSPATGNMRVKRTINFRPLTLFKHLVEMNLDQSLSFVKAEKRAEQDMAKQTASKREIDLPATISPNEPDTKKPQEIVATAPVKKPATTEPATMETKLLPVAEKKSEPVAKIEQPAAENKVAVEKVKKPADEKQPSVTAVNEPLKKDNKPGIVTKEVVEDKSQAANLPAVTKKSDPVTTNEPSKKSEKVTEIVKTTTSDKPVIPANPAPVKNAPPVTEGKQPASKPTAEIAKSTVEPTAAVITPPVIVKKSEPVTAVKEQEKTEVKKPVETIAAPVKDAIVKSNAPKKDQQAAPVIPTSPPAAANVAERKISNTQEVFYKSDSLILTLYDNGEVDGDTVSVLMNGNIIFSKQGLTTRANSKTIHMSRDMPDSIVLVMYAENLGSIPPNTGLLVVRDGEAVYEVRFRADLQSNAAIMLRRKKKE